MLSTDFNKNIVMVILAAGKSSRMNAIKQLLPWKDGTLLTNAIQIGKASKVSSIIVVLGANSTKIKPSIKKLDIGVIDNIHWKNGLGSSLACAVNYIEDHEIHAEGVLFCLADMPFVTVKHLNALISHFELNKHSIVATKLDEKSMVPAILDTSYFGEIGRLSGDQGAKYLFKKYTDNLKFVAVESAQIVKDIDTPEEYNQNKIR